MAPLPPANRSQGVVLERFLPRYWRGIALLVSLLAGVLFGVSAPGIWLEHAVDDVNAGLRRHPASGELHIIEIDAASIASIERWPWPRSNYVSVIDRLGRAGVGTIAFDVDFSSRSNPADDSALAAAVARSSSRIILPTFSQAAGSSRDNLTDSLPIAGLRDNVALGSVSIQPDNDGVVRRAPVGTVTGGLPRPSLSAAMAKLVAGAAGADFSIDYAIDPATIPRHSFIDIRDGRFNPRELAGKTVLIGATAIEMGDRYAVPGHGVIPGVVIQALAAESLRGGIPREAGWPIPLAFAVVLATLILNVRNERLLLCIMGGAPVLILLVVVEVRALLGWQVQVVPALVVLALSSALTYLARVWLAMQVRRMHDAATGLPNRLALYAARHGAVPGATHVAAGQAGVEGLVVARFAEYDKLVAALGATALPDLVRRVQERVALVAEGQAIYRVEDRALAWVSGARETLEEQLATLRTIMLPPVEVSGRRIDVALNYGFAWRGENEGIDHLLGRSLLAADQALARGVAWHAHDGVADEEIEQELSLLGELDDAIGAGDIDVQYQPKLALATGRIASVEALVRWNHRTRGRLGPDAFIPLAERNDRIAGLTLHVLEQAIADLAAWQARGLDISAAVNISAKLVGSPEFCGAVRQVVGRSGAAASRLIFEVTESAAVTDVEAAAASLEAFRQLGIAISIDDYGTGQSTLSYLRQLPLDELKLDRKFVQFAHLNRDDAILVQSTVNLAHELGLKVVAEGVEDAGCLSFLREIGCDMAQGYLISRPVSADSITTLDMQPLASAA